MNILKKIFGRIGKVDQENIIDETPEPAAPVRAAPQKNQRCPKCQTLLRHGKATVWDTVVDTFECPSCHTIYESSFETGEPTDPTDPMRCPACGANAVQSCVSGSYRHCECGECKMQFPLQFPRRGRQFVVPQRCAECGEVAVQETVHETYALVWNSEPTCILKNGKIIRGQHTERVRTDVLQCRKCYARYDLRGVRVDWDLNPIVPEDPAEGLDIDIAVAPDFQNNLSAGR